MPKLDRRTLALLAAAAAAAALVVAFAVLPVQAWLTALAHGLAAYGPLGAALFALLYVVGAMVMVPASALSFVAGLVYGPAGLALAWACMMATVAVSRPFARRAVAPYVLELVARRRELAAILAVIAEEGWRMVLLIRLSGIVPFGLQNYVFGIANLRVWPYLAATAIGVLPNILVYAGAGAFGQAALAGGPVGPERYILPALAILAGGAVIAITIRKVRAKLLPAG